MVVRFSRFVNGSCRLATGIVVVLAGCSRIEAVLDDVIPAPATPHEAYLSSLESAGLVETALARRWLAAARAALRSPISLDPPFEEISFYPAEEPTAAAYRISLRRGQSIHLTYSLEPDGESGVFIDVFRLSGDVEPQLVASARDGSRELEFEPADAGDFVVRIQPELLRNVRVRLRVIRTATLAFPVFERDQTAIRSTFGADREAGRRLHEGVDIFAPRGTPVLAAADGVVSRVGTQRLGGLVVWVRDSRRGHSHYYAHLDRQLVERGDLVRVGDTLGLVGNTGNARSTPPHLHFGLYERRRGAIDPYDFLAAQPTAPAPIRADTSRLGEWVRTTGNGRLTVGTLGEPADLPRHTVIRVLGAAGARLRVRLPDGRTGALSSAAVEPLDGPIDETRLSKGSAVLVAPAAGALSKAQAPDGSLWQIVGRFNDYLLVRDGAALEGWLPGAP